MLLDSRLAERPHVGDLVVSFILVSIAGNVLADGYSRPVVMTGVTQMADTAELHFDPAPKDSGTLVILGDHTKTSKQSYSFVYSVLAAQHSGVDPAVNLDFSGKQKLTILCDPRSDNCISTGYVTFGSATFSMLWKVTLRISAKPNRDFG
ncbi:hypothetical protein AYM40_03255 [Paraburkholderia phytofirmans OLGA172]|uniref:Uncharacterized protein n=1 Tax=Paraburkholderia phytofirmans OLGA172 TaxID=1417228 RepID=A0A160FHH5_9BURK|nr:hypothetical protein [Paraburkholderia phytofirmans]ANB71494.1 hypothetical protein AYM40_03255 [Paraburkholderia phytofirmans OLGA172]